MKIRVHRAYSITESADFITEMSGNLRYRQMAE